MQTQELLDQVSVDGASNWSEVVGQATTVQVIGDLSGGDVVTIYMAEAFGADHVVDLRGSANGSLFVKFDADSPSQVYRFDPLTMYAKLRAVISDSTGKSISVLLHTA